MNKMKTENLISKGVKHHFNGQETVFEVESLNENFEGLQIQETDIFELIQPVIGSDEDFISVNFIKESDINFANAVAKEVAPKEDIIAMTYEEAEKLLKIGGLIALPEWKGFWFNDIKTGETLVLTKEGDVINTPSDEFKERNDWITVEATEEQGKLLDVYFAQKEESEKVELTVETPAPKKKKKK
jgi:hypothetical protein